MGRTPASHGFWVPLLTPVWPRVLPGRAAVHSLHAPVWDGISHTFAMTTVQKWNVLQHPGVQLEALPSSLEAASPARGQLLCPMLAPSQWSNLEQVPAASASEAALKGEKS